MRLRSPARGLDDVIGGTPLVDIGSLSRVTGCRILGKCEFLNPGGSVKDRAALFMLDGALARGDLRPGGTVVEATAGNTGISLAWLAPLRGVRCSLVVPSSASPEKVGLLRALGAAVTTCGGDEDGVAVALEITARTPGAWFANQFENEANRRAHVWTTALEILEDCGDPPYAVVAAVGSGGTLAGLGEGFAARNVQVRCVGADPHGTPFAALRGEAPGPPPESVLEGVGQHRVTAHLARARLDGCWVVPDTASLAMLRWVLQHDGLFLGGTAALNLCGAVLEAWQAGPGHTIVAILCDGGGRSVSRLHNPAWLSERGICVPETPWEVLRGLLP